MHIEPPAAATTRPEECLYRDRRALQERGLVEVAWTWGQTGRALPNVYAAHRGAEQPPTASSAEHDASRRPPRADPSRVDGRRDIPATTTAQLTTEQLQALELQTLAEIPGQLDCGPYAGPRDRDAPHQ